MPETYHGKKVFSLLEVTRSIQKTLSDRYSTAFWVKAEMNKLNHYTHSGHCYPDLVEKKEGKVIAQIRSSLWKEDYRRVNERFLEVLKEPLKDGITILFAATIHFDPLHGLSLRILEIDPVYSLGELEREKQESILRLTEEGIFDRNKKTNLPLLPKTIAVISVETSKGYSDYLKVIDHNPWGYKIHNFLFPSLLQGEKSISSILNQLTRIKKIIHHFDAVAIIRGGGGDVGLSSFNSYALAREIALFPIPVITGIGHSTNETVAELAAFRNAITPTELADFLIQKFHDFSVPVRRAEEMIVERSIRMIKEENLRLRNFIRFFQSITHNRLLKNRHQVDGLARGLIQESKFVTRKESDILENSTTQLMTTIALTFQRSRSQLDENTKELESQVKFYIQNCRQSLQFTEKNIAILDPINVLRRGFSITLDKTGKAVKNPGELETNESLTTIFANGKVTSVIKDIIIQADNYE
jgi:exodeoxyribonuclease VII large subunit